MFTQDSVIVKSWVRTIQSGSRSIDDVPSLSNLREVVDEALKNGQD